MRVVCLCTVLEMLGGGDYEGSVRVIVGWLRKWKVVVNVPRRALPIHLFRHFSCRTYCLATMSQCYRQMDRQTDRQIDGQRDCLLITNKLRQPARPGMLTQLDRLNSIDR